MKAVCDRLARYRRLEERPLGPHTAGGHGACIPDTVGLCLPLALKLCTALPSAVFVLSCASSSSSEEAADHFGDAFVFLPLQLVVLRPWRGRA